MYVNRHNDYTMEYDSVYLNNLAMQADKKILDTTEFDNTYEYYLFQHFKNKVNIT